MFHGWLLSVATHEPCCTHNALRPPLPLGVERHGNEVMVILGTYALGSEFHTHYFSKSSHLS